MLQAGSSPGSVPQAASLNASMQAFALVALIWLPGAASDFLNWGATRATQPAASPKASLASAG
jgi:hypothetical protein